VDSSDLRHISGVTDVRESGDKTYLYTDEPGRTIQRLVDYCRSGGIEIVTLNTLTPTLEDVFIKLTGEERGVEEMEESVEVETDGS
jgi:ABC-2 type transport system ATP-binding protein